jgi:hypothetical protein
MKDLLVSRRFWAAFIAVAVILVAVFVPSFEMDNEEAAGLVIVISSYIIGVTVDPGPGGWRGIFMSRKFWAAVVGLVVLVLRGFQIGLPFDLTPDQLTSLMVVIGTFIAGSAIDKYLPAAAK